MGLQNTNQVKLVFLLDVFDILVNLFKFGCEGGPLHLRDVTPYVDLP